MSGTITPHGGVLIDRYVPEAEVAAFRAAAERLPLRLQLNTRQLCDLDMIASGAYSPLEGFFGQADYRRVLDEMRLANGAVWSIPITLPVTTEFAEKAKVGSQVALVDESDGFCGVLDVQEVYPSEPDKEGQAVFRTLDEEHPGIKVLRSQPPILLGGAIRAIRRPSNASYAKYVLTPRETRAIFAERGWKTVVGFQTRNPVHRAHEYLQKVSLEIVDGLLLHPLVGETKADDVPADVRFRCYEVLLENYYPKNRVLLSALPASMRYAGPREAILHAIARQNYGCTHFIVGRDHAGVGSYYGSYDAQQLFDEIPSGDLAISIFKFENTFYCQQCQSMASERTCPHGAESRLSLSGTKVRAMFRAGQLPPPEFSRPEVAQILIDSMRE